jgi:hypothetical protein
MQGVHIEYPYLVATDGHILTVVDILEVCKEDNVSNAILEWLKENNGKLIPSEQWKTLCMPKCAYLEGSDMHDKKGNVIGRLTAKDQEIVGRFPNWKAVMPKMASTIDAIPLGAFDPFLLHRAAQSMGISHGVKLYTEGEMKAIYVMPRQKEGINLKTVSIIIPVMDKNTNTELACKWNAVFSY